MNKFNNTKEVAVRVMTTTRSGKVTSTTLVVELERPRDLTTADALNIASNKFAQWSAKVAAVKAAGASFAWATTAPTTLSVYADGAHVWNSAHAVELGQSMGVMRAFVATLKQDAAKVRTNVLGGLAVWEATCDTSEA